MTDQSTKMPVFEDSKTYWSVLRKEQEKDKFDMMSLIWEIHNDYNREEHSYDDGDPISWFMDRYGANALYFTFPDEFDTYMEYEYEQVLDEQFTLETDKNLLEVLTRFVNNIQ